MSYEAVIGLESTRSCSPRPKSSAAVRTSFGAPPNTHVCPVCLGLPGALPVLNRRAVDLAARAALALGCRVNPRSIFARKNYFYPDLPKGYQISQYDQPLASGGLRRVGWPSRARASASRACTWKKTPASRCTKGSPIPSSARIVDYNRAGVPLIEIVSEPDLRSAGDAAAFFEHLRDMLVWLGVNDGNMEEGSLRCDANVSVRPVGQARARAPRPR